MLGLTPQNTSDGEEGAAGRRDMFEAGQGAVGVGVEIGMQRSRQGAPCEVWEVSGRLGAWCSGIKGPVVWLFERLPRHPPGWWLGSFRAPCEPQHLAHLAGWAVGVHWAVWCCAKDAGCCSTVCISVSAQRPGWPPFPLGRG